MAASERLELRVSVEWLDLLDGARGGVARGTFVKQVVEKALGSAGSAALPERGSSSASSRPSAYPLADRQAALNKAKGL